MVQSQRAGKVRKFVQKLDLQLYMPTTGLSTKGESNNMDKLQRNIYLELKRVDEVKLNIHVRLRVII